MSLPLEIVEVGPRDGLQSEPDVLATPLKLELISRLRPPPPPRRRLAGAGDDPPTRRTGRARRWARRPRRPPRRSGELRQSQARAGDGRCRSRDGRLAEAPGCAIRRP